MKRPKLTKSTLRGISFFLGLAVLAGGVWGPPWLARLEQKSPEGFAALREEFKSLHWVDAGRRAWEIHSLSAEEALALRYRWWKERVEENPEFAQQMREAVRSAREASREERLSAHRQALSGLEREKPPAFAGGREPWKLAVAMRDECRKYLEIQWRARARRDAAVSDAAGKCAYWVPLSDDTRVVSRALFTLRDKLDYVNYLKLLEALEISSEEALGFEERLRRMTGSFSAS